MREFDALDELKDLWPKKKAIECVTITGNRDTFRGQDIKLNFLFVVLFAPVLPWGIIPTLLARLLEVRCKLPPV